MIGNVAPEQRHDGLYYLTRIYRDPQLTPKQEPHRRRSRTSGSDRSYVRFLAVNKKTGRVRAAARRRVDSLEILLQESARLTDKYDVYACPNGYWRAGAIDGRAFQWRYTAKELRWLNSVVIDLDRKHVANYPEVLAMWERDPEAVLQLIHERLGAAGVTNYLIVQTNPVYGLQVHVLLKPCRANYTGANGANSTATFREVSAALYRLFERFGADKGAWKRPTQVFRLPGLGRPEYPRYQVELIVDHQAGQRVGLYDLFRRLFAMGLIQTPEMQRQQRLQAATASRVRYLPWAGARTLLSQRIAAGEVRGMADGRRQMAYRLALALFAEARLHHPDRDNYAALPGHVEHLVRLWNGANLPPLPDKEITDAVASAANGCGRVTGELWTGVCEALGVRVAHPYAAWQNLAKSRTERTRDHQEEVEEDLVAFLQTIGEKWEGLQGQLPELLQAARGLDKAPALRTVQRALTALCERGVISLATKRGRGGCTRITLIAAAEQPVTDNTVNMSSPNAGGAIAPDGVPLVKTDGGWNHGCAQARDLLCYCQDLFGAAIVVDGEEDGQQDAAGGCSPAAAVLPAESYHERVTREVATSAESTLVGLLVKARGAMRVAMLSQVAAELRLASRSVRLAGAVACLTTRLGALQAAAWSELQRGQIEPERLDWLVEVQVDAPGLRRVLSLAGEWSLGDKPRHRVVLARTRERLRWLEHQAPAFAASVGGGP